MALLGKHLPWSPLVPYLKVFPNALFVLNAIVSIMFLEDFSNKSNCEPIHVIFTHVLCLLCGSGSSVGIATDYGLDGPGIESR